MSLARNSVIYLFSNVLNATIPFLLLPILTRVLSPGEYGQIAMFQALVTGLAAFVGLNTVGAANRKFYDHNCTEKELSEFNMACLQVLVVSSLVLLVLCFAFSQKIGAFLAIPDTWIYSALLLSTLSFVVNLRLGQWQIRNHAFKFGGLQVGSSVLNVGLSLLLVLAINQGAQGRVDAQVIAMTLSAATAYWFLKKDKLVTIWRWSPSNINQALSFGVPLVPHVFGFFLLSSVDRFIINQQIGLQEAGIYMVAVQISMVLKMIFDAINKAYVPWLFGKLKIDNENDKRKIVKYTYIYFVFLLVITPIPFVIGPWFIALIAGENYSLAGDIIGWLCLGQIFGGMYLTVTNYIFYSKKTGKLSMITFMSGLVNVSLLYILIEYSGLQGAGIAFALSKALQFISTWFVASSTVSMPWKSLIKLRCL